MAEEDEINTCSPATQAKGGRQRKEILPSIVLCVCLAAFLVKALTSLVQESATWDETTYFGLGKYILQNHRWDVPGATLHPPLSYFIHDIPLLLFPTDQSVWTDFQSQTNVEMLKLSGIVRGQALLSSPANHGDRLLILSRVMMVLTAVLLGWFVYLWSYSLYGKWSAMLAVILYSFSPEILANARLITPDITLTTFSFITLYYFWKLLSDNQIRDTVLGGLCFGLALLSKFTGLLLFPICVLLMALWGIKQKTLKVSYCLLLVTMGIGILFLGYGMNLTPYFHGISYQRESAEYHESFLMGEYSTTGWWYYFIMAFLVKTPIATMVFLVIALILYVRKILERAWINEMFLLIPAAAIFCFFSVEHQSMGLRYILPIYPFLFVFASSAAQFFLSNKILTGLSVVATGWYIGASCYIHPHYLAYFNELAGGPDNGYKYLVDSNLDWGQDLKGLKKYMQKHGISRINLSYFGTDSPARYGISFNWLPSWILFSPDPEKRKLPTKGWFAISATNLQGTYFDDKDLYAWFRDHKPVAKIGYSIFIYKIDD
jgi:4-amino-4-deoxy-L-arabinose transferase-like glycosyltransferase